MAGTVRLLLPSTYAGPEVNGRWFPLIMGLAKLRRLIVSSLTMLKLRGRTRAPKMTEMGEGSI